MHEFMLAFIHIQTRIYLYKQYIWVPSRHNWPSANNVHLSCLMFGRTYIWKELIKYKQLGSLQNVEKIYSIWKIDHNIWTNVLYLCFVQIPEKYLGGVFGWCRKDIVFWQELQVFLFQVVLFSENARDTFWRYCATCR